MYQFENLVNYDKSKTLALNDDMQSTFENLVNYDKSKTTLNSIRCYLSLRTL